MFTMSAFQFPQPCYAISQVETMLSISCTTVNRRIKEGVFKKFQLGANFIWITADTVHAFSNGRVSGSRMGSYAKIPSNSR